MQQLFSLLVMVLVFLQVGCAADPTYQPKAVSLQDGAELRPSRCQRQVSRAFKICDVPDVTVTKIGGIKA